MTEPSDRSGHQGQGRGGARQISPRRCSTTRFSARRSRVPSAPASARRRPSASAMSAVGVPAAADVERLERRLRSLSDAARGDRGSPRRAGQRRRQRSGLATAPQAAPSAAEASRPSRSEARSTPSSSRASPAAGRVTTRALATATPRRLPTSSAATVPRSTARAPAAIARWASSVGLRVVVVMGAGDGHARDFPAREQGRGERGVSFDGARGAVGFGRDRRLGHEERPRLETGVEGSAGAEPDGPLDAERGELGQDDRDTGPADAGGLDGQLPACGRGRGVAP